MESKHLLQSNNNIILTLLRLAFPLLPTGQMLPVDINLKPNIPTLCIENPKIHVLNLLTLHNSEAPECDYMIQVLIIFLLHFFYIYMNQIKFFTYMYNFVACILVVLCHRLHKNLHGQLVTAYLFERRLCE